MASLDFIRVLVAAPLPTQRTTSADGLRAHVASLTSTNTVERAALAGFAADGVGWGFAGGYQAAQRCVDPSAVANGQLAALCVTEKGGGHPRAMQTKLIPRTGGGWTLSGRKTFVTLGADADVLFVVASVGADAAGRNRLRIARVPAGQAGVTITPLDPLPFAPEIGHATATLQDVEVSNDAVLEGDGYERVVKPFRTIEDVHVMAAIVGWSINVARRSGWEQSWIEEAAAVLVALRAVGDAPPLAPETHLVLAGVLPAVRRLLESAPWSSADAVTRENWERDRALLDVASRVRAARREAAWTTLTRS